jgi:hypothetical protein
MNNIIDKIPGTTSEGMVEYCESLLRVMSQEEHTNVGAGKNVRVVSKHKYSDADVVIPKIVESIKHYSSMTNNFSLRDYQIDIANRAAEILKKSRFVYLAMEVRTGKTLTALEIASMLKAQNVLFLTKKKAISSIEMDYAKKKRGYRLEVINYESMHHLFEEAVWDVIIADEAHCLGAFPKPSERAIALKNLISANPCRVILMSGTPTPESYSQMYHQLYGIPVNPFSSFSNFYKFCDVHVKLKHKKVNGYLIRDYSHGFESIIDAVRPYMINYSQKDAGFNTVIEEEILFAQMKESTTKMIDRLKKELVIQGKSEVILGDTAVKLMSKLHQLYSGTIKFESGNSMVIDPFKAKFIKDRFAGKKIGIFYKFKEELEALKSVFKDDLTTDIGVFDDTSKSIALQIVSGREGISLRKAEYLVYYNIDFSATSYWQSRDRMTTIDRLANKIFWIFSVTSNGELGIENDIHEAVSKKMDYTVNHFKKREL